MVTALSVYRSPFPLNYMPQMLSALSSGSHSNQGRTKWKKPPSHTHLTTSLGGWKDEKFPWCLLSSLLLNAPGSDISMLFFNAFILRTRERIQVCVCIVQRNSD